MIELTGDQMRVQTNAVQTFEAWREADQTFRHSYRGRMNWSAVRGRKYLYRIIGESRQSLGPQSEETERIKDEYSAQRTRLRERRDKLAKRLAELAPINRAYRIGRVPEIATRVVAALDQAGLLGSHLLIVGTHSLYAYEAAAGVHFASDIMTTVDIDLMWDARNKLKLAALDISPEGVMGILRKVDKTFAKTKRPYQAANDDGYFVDLIRPVEPSEALRSLRGIGSEIDLEAAAIMGLQWLINAPRFEQVAISEQGRPVRLCCTDPRAFALHKLWLATEAPQREAGKRQRDRLQALAAASVASERLGLKMTAKDLSALPRRLSQHAADFASPRRRR